MVDEAIVDVIVCRDGSGCLIWYEGRGLNNYVVKRMVYCWTTTEICLLV